MFFEPLKLYSSPTLMSNTFGTHPLQTWTAGDQREQYIKGLKGYAFNVVFNEEKNIVITILLPGVEIKNLVISAIRPKLKISIHDFKIPPGACARMYDPYEFSLADTDDLDNITASLNAGVLTITIPRLVEQKENIKIIPVT